ncbi:MAG: 30S ribosome-binding factor RbfA [Ruminococcus sp.]|nr:30S ribosome-binding factor RbfA [Ruminococcus sp.]MCI6888908.1 30S ribosome-binding factor RbfA [Ruminococcus sp.]MDD6634864.1 30S ribosome-binding factor RbfA [Ruminococcus sp.]MDY3214187.1 30S ribosome-binding factor RbfA [Ruminococcus sp.]HOF68042.1 30S ribosome-binding factor RbfA [Ruminococcus sp.]
MASFKNGRLAEDIKREMTAIVRELKDPRIAEFLTIVRVELSGDMSHCKIYVSCFEGLEKAKESVKGLSSGEGFIKRELFHRLKMRKCPELKFIADDSIAHSAEINKKLREI